ncbi:MAG: SMP-30/gluconolactonase/LRE family protein [Candidatus Syntrophosphaera sp.]
MTRYKSRIILILIIVVLLLLAAYVLLRFSRPNPLNNPESIVYDETQDRFLISNAGNGRIISMNPKGSFDILLKDGLANPRGMKLKYPNLYVTDNTQVKVIDLEQERIAESIPIPGSIMLNDIEFDHLGKLYVTDTKANTLYILDPATKEIEEVRSPLLKAPNGIIYDYPRKQMLIVCLKEGSPILSYGIEDMQVTTFMPTLYDNLDGIAIDDLGRIYFSSWSEKAIFQIPQEQNRTLIWQEGIESPADIYYHQPTGEILVPNFKKNEILRFAVG